MKRKLNIQDVKCTSIYLLIYSGAIKLMFPGLSLFVNILEILTVLVCVMLFLSPQKNNFFYKSTVLPILLLTISFIIMLLTAFSSPNVAGAIIRGRSIILTLAHMYLIFFISLEIDDEFIDKIEKTIIVGNTILLFSYFFFNMTTIISGLQSGFRLGDMTGNPIWISRVCGDTMLCIYLKNKRLKRKYHMFLLILIGLINLMTISKGPIIAAIIAFLFYHYKNDKRTSRKIIRDGALILFCLLLWYMLYSFGDDSLKYKLSISVATTASQGSRMDRYAYSINMIRNNLLTGKGLGSWPMLYWSQYYDLLDASAPEFIFGYPHNIFLEILFESGFIAFFPYILGIYFFFKIAGRNITLNNELQVVLVANLMYAMFSGSATDGNRGLYCILALCCGVLNVRTKNKKICVQGIQDEPRSCKGVLECK